VFVRREEEWRGEGRERSEEGRGEESVCVRERE
jgi:hypothetical protein